MRKPNSLTICAYCGTLIEKWIYQIRKHPRHFCSNSCKGKWMSLNLISNKACNWKGGTYSTIARMLCNYRYRNIRKTVLFLDNNKCAICSDFIRLEIHHIIEKGKNPALIWDITNMITLCKKCHCGIRSKEINYIGFFNAIVEKRANSVKPVTDNAVGNPELNSNNLFDKCVETMHSPRKG